MVDGLTGAFLDSQAVDLDADGVPELLLFQADYLPRQARPFAIHAVMGDMPAPVQSRVFGRYVPERKDDFAWENDRAAFRMYGPALASEGARAGIDMWVKSVRYPIINKWYADGDYHEDHGEGMDAYSVGPTLGCGGLGIYENGTLFTPPVYESQRLIASGPIRVLFELGYPSLATPRGAVTLKLRVALDRGHSLNEIRAAFDGADGPLPIAASVALHGGIGSLRAGDGWVSVAEPVSGAEGETSFCAAVFPGARLIEDAGHAMLVREIDGWTPVRYLAGGGWTGGPDFQNESEWLASLRNEAEAMIHPVRKLWVEDDTDE